MWLSWLNPVLDCTGFFIINRELNISFGKPLPEMPLSPAFTITQDAGTSSIVRLTDTSTGTNSGITTRRVYLRKYDGSYLVPLGTLTTYILWPYSSSTIDISVLAKDYALDVTVYWMTGATITNTDTKLALFKDYSETHLYNLSRNQTANPKVINSSNYFYFKSMLRELIDDAVQAVNLFGDQTTAQLCLNEAKLITDKTSYFH